MIPLMFVISSILEFLIPVPLTVLSGSPPNGTAKVTTVLLVWLMDCSILNVSEKRFSWLPFPEETLCRNYTSHCQIPAPVQGNFPSGEQWVNWPDNHSISLISPCRGVLFVLSGLDILYPAFLVIYLKG